MSKPRRLTKLEIESLPAGWHGDGDNLYLRVRANGSRSWVFRYKSNGKVVEIGLKGSLDRDLKDVRALAGKMREALIDGRDPRDELKARVDPNALTFRAYAEQVIADKSQGLHKHKYVKQWSSTLETYVYPSLGRQIPSTITISDILAILRPLWPVKTETAKRLRQRIEAVLDAAAIHENDPGRSNPARWTGVLSKLLQPPHKVTPVIHHTAAPYGDVPRIYAALKAKDHMSALCLRLIILTACRSGEARGATWAEIDLEAQTWTIPVGRMKARREHRVPLSDEAVAILKVMQTRKLKDNDRVFPGAGGKLLSDVAVNKTLHAVAPGVTVHGFRSSFRDWAGEVSNFPREIAEAALAHSVGDSTERAYWRGDAMEKRKKMMQAWCSYCNKIAIFPKSNSRSNNITA